MTLYTRRIRSLNSQDYPAFVLNPRFSNTSIFLAARYISDSITTTWLLSTIFCYLKMGFDKSKKGRKPNPKRNTGNTTNIGAGSERYFLRRRPINLASFENSIPSIPTLSPTPSPRSTTKGGKKKKVTFDDAVESSQRKNTKIKNSKGSSKLSSARSRSSSSTFSKREGLRSGSRSKDKQAISQTTGYRAQAREIAANSNNKQTSPDTARKNGNEAFNLQALPTEIRAVIWADLAGYEGPVRIIEVRINQTGFRNPTFTIDSPTGPYQAPDIRAVIASPEGLRQFNTRFPNRLSLPGSRDIYFNTARDIIYMDVRSLWSLFELDRSVIAPGLVSLYTPLPRPAGFRKIRNLATPFEDNNLEGINTLRERTRGQLKGVVDPIRTLKSVPDAIETLGRLNLHFTAMYWENRYGQRDSYLAAIGEWPSFFGPPI
jgi:hypothetical protein